MAKGIQLPVVQSGLEASIEKGVKNVGTINIPATIDPSSFKGLAQPLGKVSGLATEFEKSIAASNARVLAFGASVGIINGVQNAFADLLKTGIEVQKTLADIAAISGQSGKELSKFGDALFDVGKLTGQSFQIASQAALEFSRQGLSVEETLKRTTDALTLTRFTSLNAAEAVDVLTAATNSFSDTGITTAEIINKLVAVDTKFAVSAEDLAKGLARAGSIAQEVGVSFDELNAAVTIAQERTARGGAVIGNALKTIFTRIRSDETVQALRDIGVESLNAQGQLKGAIPLLQEVADKIQGISGGERVQILEAIASKYNINILSALLSDLNGANSKFVEAVGISAGASNQAYERQIELNKTLAAELNRASVSATQLFNKLAEIGVTDSLATLLKFVNNIVDGFNKLLDSEGIGGNIARGLVKGISDIFFTVGLPVLGAIFIKLTADIAKFGAESLKTILGINQQVRERQALEQAVVNTLIRDQEIMATILSLSGNRAKQEEYLLGIYNRQLAALQQVQNIAASVTPALMAGGLSATSGQIRKRGAGGYLPAQEAADVRRGVGGASASSKVVSIPNFAFGGGKRGTMVANTSEYIVPNFANGGSAIFNKDMVKAYGLPAGARKISAAGGYVPNFARYVYDSDRIEPDKNALLKAILTSKAKKNVIIGPPGSGKSTYGASLGQFITNVGQLADATEIDILSAAARTKDGGLSKNFQQILDAVNLSGGKASYLYAGNMDIYSRRAGRVEKGAMEGDLRTGKELSRTLYAPMNQFDFVSKVKRGAKNFQMIKGAGGYVPNFAKEILSTNKYAGIVPGDVRGQSPAVGYARNGDAYSFPMIYAGAGAKSGVSVSSIRDQVIKISKDLATQTATGYALAFDPDLAINREAVAQKATLANQNKGSIESFVGSIFEASISAVLSDAHFKESQARSAISTFDFSNNEDLTRIFSVPPGVRFLEAKNNAAQPNLDKIAEKISRVETKRSEAFSAKRATLKDSSTPARWFTEGGKTYLESEPNKFELVNPNAYRLGPNQQRKNLPQGAVIRGSKGYIPNFAAGSPLGDAINREMAAGLNPSQIRVTQDGRLRNSGNPNGLAVINTRDEPNGKIPNFARLKLQTPEQIAQRLAQNRAEPMFQSAQRQTIDWEPSSGSVAKPMGAMPSYKEWSDSFRKTANDAEGVSKGMKKVKFGMDKMFYAFSGITAASSILEETFKDSKTEGANYVRTGTAVAQGAASGAMALSMFGPWGMLAGGVMGGALAGYKEAVQPLEIQKQQQAEIMKAELSPQGATAEERVKNLEKSIEYRKNLERRLTRDAANTTVQSGLFRLFSSEQGASELTDQAKASAEQRARLTQELEKQKKILEEQKQKEAEIKQEVANRIVLASEIGKLNVEYAKGQAVAAEHIAAKQAEIIAISTSLTAEQKLQREERQRVYELEKKIEAVQGDTLHSLLKQIASQSKLANVSKDSLRTLQEKFNKGEALNLEEEAKKLGIQDYSQLASALQTAKESAAIKNTELESEKNRLQTLIDANKQNRELTAQYTAQLQLVNYTYDINKQIQALKDADSRAEASLKKGDRLRQLKNESLYRGYNTRQQQRELDYQQSIFDYDQKSEDIFQETLKSKKTNLDLAKEAIKQEVGKVEALKDQKAIVNNILNTAKTAEDLFAYKKDTSGLTGVDLTNAETFNRILAEQIRFLREKDGLSEKDYRRQIELLGLNPRDNEANFRRKLGTTFQGGMYDAMKEINIEASSFSEDFGKNTTLAFRDGMRDAMSAAISQTDDLGAALQNVATNFLKTMQNMFLQNAANNTMRALQSAFPNLIPQTFAKGGIVSGGSGYRDDVPAMLTGGEFVMRKAAVQKYGIANLDRMNNGGFFLPGVRGGKEISGYKDLTAFANQTTTSGATDVLMGGKSMSFANLEDQSGRLSAFALLNDQDIINQEIRSAQEQALNIITEREKYRTAQRKAFQSQLKQTVISAALNYGAGQLAGALTPMPKTSYSGPMALGSFSSSIQNGQVKSLGPTALGSFQGMGKGMLKNAYGGMIRRYAAGGPTDDIPALLMGGEYIMNRQTTNKYGKAFFDSMNQGRLPRFADGGQVSTSEMSFAEKAASAAESKSVGGTNVSINISVAGGTTDVQTQGETNQKGVDYKKMGEQIKQIVIQTINEEKRLGGSLRSR